MKIDYIHEPELQFGLGQHIDLRYGLMNFGPLDASQPTAPTKIRIGIVGTQESVARLTSWFERCGEGIAAQESEKPNFHPRFPGFGNNESMLTAPIVVTAHSTIKAETINEIIQKGATQAVVAAVDLFLDEMVHLDETKTIDVLVCAPPISLRDAVPALVDGAEVDDESSYVRADFHDLLKAQGMRFGVPLQVIWPGTYGGAAGRSRKRDTKRQRVPERRLQDEATRAWNLYTALYYKARGIPWRMPPRKGEYTTCYVGVSFYKSLDEKTTQISVAQVFNERGEGLILKGGAAKRKTKHDREVHLGADDAYNLLDRALQEYRKEHKTAPARIFLHKTSAFDDDELSGFRKAARDQRIEYLDLVSIRRSLSRLFRTDVNPPLRGTFLELDDRNGLLYTRGSVDFYRMYPGMYVPRPLHFHVAQSEQSLRILAEEMLQLTKMNWNNTQMDNSMPVTVEAARNVGTLLKYSDMDDMLPVKQSYRYYM
jgi:hypothetical protein